MTLTLMLSLVGIGLIDSLNPSLFVAQFYLLTTPRPVSRILTYILGVLVVNFSAGVLILGGVGTLITDLLVSLNTTILYGLQLAVGIVILAFGLRMKTSADKLEAQKPRSLSLLHTFVLGMVVMVNEITTALPYFVAIDQIAQAQLSTIASLLALVVYNLVFSLPLLAFVALYVAFRDSFMTSLERISQAVQTWTPRIIKYASIGFGAVLSLNAGVWLLTGIILFS